MKLMFKQRLFSWLDSYDIFDESGQTVYQVKGEFSWGKCLHVYGANGNYLGTVKQKVWTWLPKFEIFIGSAYAGRITKRFSILHPSYEIEYLDWHADGNFLEWDYEITGQSGQLIASVSKEVFHLSDTYCIDIAEPDSALHVLMLVLAIDAEKASR